MEQRKRIPFVERVRLRVSDDWLYFKNPPFYGDTVVELKGERLTIRQATPLYEGRTRMISKTDSKNFGRMRFRLDEYENKCFVADEEESNEEEIVFYLDEEWI